MSLNKEQKELSLENQFRFQRIKLALPKMSREQLEQYTETLLAHHLWAGEKYEQMLKTKWGISDE